MNQKVVIGIGVLIVAVVGALFLMKAPDGDSLIAEFMEGRGGDIREMSPSAASNSMMAASSIPESSNSTMSGITQGSIKEFSVTASNFKFDLANISVNRGDTVKINFKNDQGFHDFVIDEFSGARSKRLSAGQSETINFVADKAGSFEYYCSVGNHRQMGMKGTLTVQ